MSHPQPAEPLPDENWDVLILGTGLKQSLLACALSRASKKVLQLDPNDVYGSSDASFSNLHTEIDRWVEHVNNPGHSLPTPFSNARVWRTSEDVLPRRRGQWTLTLSPQIIYWENKLLGVLREVEMTGQFVWQAVGAWWVYRDGKEEEEERGEGAQENTDRGLAGMAASVGVKAFRAGVGLKTKGGWNKGRQKQAGSTDKGKTSAAEDSTSAPDPSQSSSPSTSTAPTTLRTIPPKSPTTSPHLKESPCTFEDIAWDPTLTDNHRTILASFLRYVLQPQQASTATPSTPTSIHTLLTTIYPLPPALRNSIHALTLLTTPPHLTPASLAIQRLKTHFLSLGRIPDIRSAAALLVQYGGAAEMCQVFCRGAAVAGGLCVLGRGVTNVSKLDDGESSAGGLSAILSTGETVRTKFLVGSHWDYLPFLHPQNTLTRKKQAFARGIYVIKSPLTPLFAPKYSDERIAPGAAMVVVYKGAKPVQVLARAACHGECPSGWALLYVSRLVAEEEGGPEEKFWESEYKVLDDAVEDILVLFDTAEDNYSTSTNTSSSTDDTHPGDAGGESKLAFKLQYTQLVYTPTSTFLSNSSTDGILTFSDVPLDFVLDGEQQTQTRDSDGDKGAGKGVGVVDDVLGMYERIILGDGESEGSGIGDGDEDAQRREAIREGFMHVDEETRRLMRENEV